METLKFEYSATHSVSEKTIVGVVGSGDLEILINPNTMQDKLEISVSSSSNKTSEQWQIIFDRILGTRALPAVCMEINDFAATPGVIRVRMEQALEEIETLGKK